MKNILLFALVAGVASALAIYLASSNDKYVDDGYVTDADLDAFDMRENNGPVKSSGQRGFHAMN